MLMKTELPFVKGKEGLANLATALDMQMPHGFVWDFGQLTAKYDGYDSLFQGMTEYEELECYLDDEQETAFKSRFDSFVKENSVPECGTVGCAVGLANFLWGKEMVTPPIQSIWNGEREKMGESFDIPIDVVDELFFPDCVCSGFEETVVSNKITPQMVAQNIRHYLETGETLDYRELIAAET